MSEPRGAERFGHAVLRTDASEIYVLDLYEHPELVFKGVYLAPPHYVRELLGIQDELVESTNVALRLNNTALRTIRRLLHSEELVTDRQSFSFANNYGTLFGQIESVTTLPNRTVWSGVIEGEAWKAEGSLDFVVEQYGSMEIYLLLLILFILVLSTQGGGEWSEANCYNRAIETCGERNIKSVNLAKRVTGTTFRVEYECQFECADRENES